MADEDASQQLKHAITKTKTQAKHDNNNNNNDDDDEDTHRAPARRRRRLAHRRQYTKSRRLASSYLRSQFVRYDSNEQLDDTFNAASERLLNANECNKKKSAILTDKTTCSEQNLLTSSSCNKPLVCCGNADKANQRHRAPSDSYDEWLSADDATTSGIVEFCGAQQAHRSRRDSLSPSRATTISSSLLSSQRRFTAQNDAADDMRDSQQRLLADCSASSLDSSCSPIDVVGAASVVEPATRCLSRRGFHQRATETTTTNSSTATASRYTTLKSPLNLSVAKSLMSLATFGHNSSADNLSSPKVGDAKLSAVGGGAKFKMLVSAGAPEPRRSWAPCGQHSNVLKAVVQASERSFVRSETIDLNRINHHSFGELTTQQQATSNSSSSSSKSCKSQQVVGTAAARQPSPKLKFFPTSNECRRLNQSTDSAIRQIGRHRDTSADGLFVCVDTKCGSSSASSAIKPTLGDGRFVSVQFRSVDQILSLKHQRENIDCIDNLHFNDLFNGIINESSSSITANENIRTDPRLTKDDVDIKFSRALNSCKLPQIRYASKERLFERLTDLRFLSIDFLNTFLLTYRVFTTAEDVLEAIKSVHYNYERFCQLNCGSTGGTETPNQQQQQQHRRGSSFCYTNSSVAELHNSCINATPNNNNSSSCSPTRTAATSQLAESSNTSNLQKGASSTTFAQMSPRQVNDNTTPPTRSFVIAPTKKPAPPLVPPRSPSSKSSGASSGGGGSSASTNLLAAPQAATAHCMQKRRSTISALTPITGSTSSSLVNLAAAAKLSSTGGGGKKCANEQEEEERTSVHFADIESATSDESAASRQRSLSVSAPQHQQQHKSAVGTTRPSPPQLVCPPTNNLTVPGRQQRASSLSHVGALDAAKTLAAAAAAAATSVKQQHNSYDGQEHWRLSYKKSTTQRNNNNNNSPNNHLLTPNNLNVGLVVPLRRKSAADADSIRLQVTLTSDAPPDDVSLASSSTHDVSSGGSVAQQQVCLSPRVPPPTPVPSGAEQQIETDRTICPSNPATRSTSTSSSQFTSDDDNDDKQDRLQNNGLVRELPCSSAGESAAEHSISSSLSSPDNAKLNMTTSDDKRCAVTNGTGGEAKNSRRRMNSVSRKRQQSFMLKEIELTQSRALDSNTSCDESSEEHSSAIDSSPHSMLSTDCKQSNKQETTQTRRRTRRKSSGTNVCNTIVRHKQDNNNDTTATLDEQPKVMNTTVGHKTQHEVPTLPEREKLSKKHNGTLVVGENELDAVEITPETLKSKHVEHTTTPSTTSTGGGCGDTSAAQKAQQQHLPPQPSQQQQQQQQQQQTKRGAPASRAHGSSASCMTTPRSSFQYSAADNPLLCSKAGVVVTSKSPRVSSRRSSTASAASAFAAATAASSNPLLTQPPLPLRQTAAAASTTTSSCAHQGANSPDLSAAHHPAAYVDPAQCACASLQARNSVSSMLPVRRNLLLGHHPSCLHYPHQFQQSDASSLCNSRASSRLSSCAGLEFSYQQQQQQQQQVGATTSRQPPLNTPINAANSGRSSYQSSALSLGCGQFGSSRYASQANIVQLNKRNSTSFLQYQQQQQQHQQQHNQNAALRSSSEIRPLATLRVMNVLRHWVSKHSQDFVNDSKLTNLTLEFLHDLINDQNLLPAEHKAAIQLQSMIQKAAHERNDQVDLDILLAPPTRPSPDSIETLSALEIAEGMSYLDHKIFLAIKSEEFLGQAWMKADKAIKAPHILLITKRFNDLSRLVSSEIIRVPELHRRVAVIEKWTNVAHICRVIHNFNGVLQICAAFTNSAVFRLKKTWDKIPKTTKATIDQLQNLVSTDSRFRNMRDAINRCDPPSIPYVGMYLTDLSFIEEGTPNYSPEGLLNFSKMRMIAHVIREIQHLQNGTYKMDLNPRVANYLLDASRHLQDDEMYRCSLAIEPRSSGTSAAAAAAAAMAMAASSSGPSTTKQNGQMLGQINSSSQQNLTSNNTASNDTTRASCASKS